MSFPGRVACSWAASAANYSSGGTAQLQLYTSAGLAARTNTNFHRDAACAYERRVTSTWIPHSGGCTRGGLDQFGGISRLVSFTQFDCRERPDQLYFRGNHSNCPYAPGSGIVLAGCATARAAQNHQSTDVQ